MYEVTSLAARTGFCRNTVGLTVEVKIIGVLHLRPEMEQLTLSVSAKRIRFIRIIPKVMNKDFVKMFFISDYINPKKARQILRE